MKSMKLILAIVLGLLCAGGSYWLLDSMGGKKKAREKSIPEVATSVVRAEPFEDRIEALGTTRATESVVITASVTELLEGIRFQEGQEVKKGDALVTLEQAEEQALLRQAQLAFDEEERLFQIAERLHGKKAVSQTEYEKQVYARNAARARLEAAATKVKERTITAPFAGQTGIRQASPGTLVTPGTPITTLDDLSVIKLFFTVPETFLNVLTAGQPVEARCAAYPDLLFKGKVSIIDTRIETDSRAVTIMAEFPNPDRKLRPGMLMRVELINRHREAPSIAEKALLSYGKRHFVFVLKPDETVERRQVELGLRVFGRVEITKGLAAGEKVVVEGINKISAGQKVKTVGPAAMEGKRP